MARYYFYQTVHEDPLLDKGWLAITNFHYSKRNYDKALHYINKALNIDSENPLYWKSVAEAEFHVGNIVSSLEAYEEASMLAPDDKEIWLDWSFIYYEQGEFDKAIDLIISGMDELPDESDYYYRVTAYLIAAGKYKEAFNYLENALILNFENHTILFEFFPHLETQKALFKIIDQFRKENS